MKMNFEKMNHTYDLDDIQVFNLVGIKNNKTTMMSYLKNITSLRSCLLVIGFMVKKKTQKVFGLERVKMTQAMNPKV